MASRKKIIPTLRDCMVRPGEVCRIHVFLSWIKYYGLKSPRWSENKELVFKSVFESILFNQLTSKVMRIIMIVKIDVLVFSISLVAQPILFSMLSREHSVQVGMNDPKFFLILNLS